ncbi:hypothetical protein PR048_020142 [Dryococelus australis]|uniref:DDE-1 domain-containing protein n=1 Tax=Dryococelus australis TaxID=614101 RepID=A0ABQ9H5H5_9NEOP|nr:hypothetical protein PR048_020142 [Dryococelus australis]
MCGIWARRKYYSFGVLSSTYNIFVRKLWSSWKGTKDIPGTFYANTEKDYMTSVVFSSYMRKFAEVVKERPIIMVFDGHMSHMDPDTIEFARSNHITILKLPPHTTYLLQPLDKCCFGPLKAKGNETLLAWQREKQRHLTKSEFVDLICSIWFEGLHPANIISGFKTMGIFPCDRTKYPTDCLDSGKLKKYLEGTTESSVIPESGQTDLNVSEEIIDRTLAAEMPSTSKPAAAVDCNLESIFLQRIKCTSMATATRRKVDVHTRVITSDEYKNEIEKATALKGRPKSKKKMSVAVGNKSKNSKTSEMEEEEVMSYG